MKKLYPVTVTSPLYKTVFDYLDDVNSLANKYADKPEAFLNIVSDTDGLSNRKRLENSLTTRPETRKLIGSPAKYLPLKMGTVFYLEQSEVNYQSFVTEGLDVVSYDDTAYKSARLAELEADKGYVSLTKPIKGQLYEGGLNESFPSCTLWLWCRSLSSKNQEGGELLGQFIDLSPFVQRVQSNQSKNGGNFTITLPPLVAELDADRKWNIQRGNLNQFENNEYVAEGSLFDIDADGELRRNQFFFQNAIKSNDLLFLRFETLQLETEQRQKDAQLAFVDKTAIPGKIYDLIGLVDSVSTSINPSGNDVSITITGRDLSKVFLDDGVFFFPIEQVNGQVRYAGGATIKNSQLGRIYGEGSLNFLSLYMHTSIEYILKFILQQLSNIKIIPNDLLEAYGERRNHKYDVEFKDKGGKDFQHNPIIKKELANGIFQIIKLNIDENVIGRLLQDASFSMAQGSLMNFLNTTCQMPLVQMFMDTYKDEYVLTVRKPPYDQKSLISLIEGKINTETGTPEIAPAIVDVEAEDVLQESLVMNDAENYSWYNFFPKNVVNGDLETLSLSYLGALYFEEYAQLYGSKAFIQSHPYMPFVPSDSNETSLSLYELQAINDYKFVIETSMYLPFVRKGTLVLNGDRRIKVGNVIRYKPTGEIFFVDAVQQNFSINENVIERTTTVQVSRGMVEQLIYGLHLTAQDGSRIFVSYFNIIDTRLKLDKQKEVKTKVYDKKPVQRIIQTAGFQNGFGEYMMHQQGPRGAEEIAHAVYSGSNVVAKDIYRNMFGDGTASARGNVGDDFAGTKTPAKFYEYWVNRYNRKYQKAYTQLSQFEHLYQSVAKETGVPVDVLRTFGEIESGHSQVVRSGTKYQGIMQVTAKEGGELGLNVYSEKDNIKTAALIYRRNSTSNPFRKIAGQTTTVTDYEEIEKEVTTKVIDREGVFGNFKVNPYTFNFFLKNLQFSPEYNRSDISRQTYNSDQAGTDDNSSVRGEKLSKITIATKKKK